MKKNSRNLKRILVPAVVVGVLASGGVAVATALDDDGLDGRTLDRAGEAALAEVGDGRVTGAETADDGAEGYEIEVTRPDGSEVDVLLDRDYAVVAQESDDTDEADEADDRALTRDEREKAGAAALRAVPGTVADVEASDDRVRNRDAAYEVEIVGADGRESVVRLDAGFVVLDTVAAD